MVTPAIEKFLRATSKRSPEFLELYSGPNAKVAAALQEHFNERIGVTTLDGMPRINNDPHANIPHIQSPYPHTLNTHVLQNPHLMADANQWTFRNLGSFDGVIAVAPPSSNVVDRREIQEPDLRNKFADALKSALNPNGIAILLLPIDSAVDPATASLMKSVYEAGELTVKGLAEHSRIKPRLDLARQNFERIAAAADFAIIDPATVGIEQEKLYELGFFNAIVLQKPQT